MFKQKHVIVPGTINTKHMIARVKINKDELVLPTPYLGNIEFNDNATYFVVLFDYTDKPVIQLPILQSIGLYITPDQFKEAIATGKQLIPKQPVAQEVIPYDKLLSDWQLGKENVFKFLQNKGLLQKISNLKVQVDYELYGFTQQDFYIITKNSRVDSSSKIVDTVKNTTYSVYTSHWQTKWPKRYANQEQLSLQLKRAQYVPNALIYIDGRTQINEGYLIMDQKTFNSYVYLNIVRSEQYLQMYNIPIQFQFIVAYNIMTVEAGVNYDAETGIDIYGINTHYNKQSIMHVNKAIDIYRQIQTLEPWHQVVIQYQNYGANIGINYLFTSGIDISIPYLIHSMYYYNPGATMQIVSAITGKPINTSNQAYIGKYIHDFVKQRNINANQFLDLFNFYAQSHRLYPHIRLRINKQRQLIGLTF